MRIISVFLFFCLFAVASAQQAPVLKVKISVSPDMKTSFIKGGRIILYLTRQVHKEPRNGFDIVVGVTPGNWDSSTNFILDLQNKEVISAGPVSEFLSSPDQFYYQVLYKQNPDDGQENVPGNIISKVDSVKNLLYSNGRSSSGVEP